MLSPGANIPLLPIEVQVRNHAIMMTVGFLILLPLGSLIARYARTFTRKWFWTHATIQLVLSAPIIYAGWAYGHKSADDLGLPHFMDPHQKMGLALLILYTFQLALGLFMHFVPWGRGLNRRRPLHNYFHVFLGLVILVVANSQVHYGLYIEWPLLGNLHPVPDSAKNAWVALVTIFWALYLVGMFLLPRQFRQEKETREAKKEQLELATDSNSSHRARDKEHRAT